MFDEMAMWEDEVVRCCKEAVLVMALQRMVEELALWT